MVTHSDFAIDVQEKHFAEMISLTAKRLSPYIPRCKVELEGDERTLTNIVEKLKLFRNLDKDLREINPDDIKPALDVLLKR